MRPLLAAWLLLALLAPASGLGRLVQPDGSATVLAEVPSPGGYTLLFAPRSVSSRSWLTLPAGSVVAEVELVGPGYRSRIAFPKVAVPGVRFAVEVAAPVLALTVRGRLGEGRTLFRSLRRPETPGEVWIVRSKESLSIHLPPWGVASGSLAVMTLTRPASAAWSASVTGSGKSLSFAFQASVLRWDYTPAAWGFVPTLVEVRGADPRLSEVKIRALGPAADLPVDPPTLLAWPRQAWRSDRREWFSWTGTSILVLVTADYRVQDDYLKRLAFYVEKTGYRGRLVSNQELAGLHGWNAHDYSAPDLARFFTQAARERFPLNPSEQELRDRLLAAGILSPQGQDAWEPGTGALVGISSASPPALRAVLFAHEAFHGLYFTSPPFRAGAAAAWKDLSEEARRAFRAFLARSQYDPSDEALMVNEFQAYVLQRPSVDWLVFFRDRVLGANSGAASLSWLTEYLAAARRLENLVESLFGARSGSVSAVTTL